MNSHQALPRHLDAIIKTALPLECFCSRNLDSSLHQNEIEDVGFHFGNPANGQAYSVIEACKNIPRRTNVHTSETIRDAAMLWKAMHVKWSRPRPAVSKFAVTALQLVCSIA